MIEKQVIPGDRDFNYFYVNGIPFSIVRSSLNKHHLLGQVYDWGRNLERAMFISGLEYEYITSMCWVIIKSVKDFDKYVDVLMIMKNSKRHEAICTITRKQIEEYFNEVLD